jgi:hypothetical protein
MPMHKGCKSHLIMAADVVLQQLPIGQPRPISQKHHPAKVLDDFARLAGRHVLVPQEERCPPSTLLLAAQGRLIRYFFACAHPTCQPKCC